MARNQVAADTATTSKKRSKTEGKSKTNTNKNKKKKNKNTIDANGNKAMVDKLLIPQLNEIKEEDDNEEVEADSKKNNPSSKKEEKKEKQQKNKKKKVEKEEEEEDTKNESQLYNFPMNRISRIIKGESDVRITQEAVFLINKASEKFLQLLSTEAFACSFLDKKNHISYQHLSSVVSKRRRFDFLSDFVPEKVKVEDALKETPSVET